MQCHEARCSACDATHSTPRRQRRLKIIGFSCVELSKQSTNNMKKNELFCSVDVQSGVAFDDLIEDLRTHGGEVIIAENVD